MATTNLLQWNPTAANQESDAQYLADSQRVGGATDPSIFEAELANKAFYQWSTYLTALFQAFAAKGFTTSDSNLNTLAATCSAFLTSNDLIAVRSQVGGPLISATQASNTYGSSPTTAAIMAFTQSNSSNYLFAACDAQGNANFWVQASGLISASSLQLSGSITTVGGANIQGGITTSTIMASGNITGGGLISNGSASVAGNLSTGGFVSVGGNLTAASINSNGSIAAAGAITGISLTVPNNVQGGGLISTGNAVVAGNLNTGSFAIGGGAPAGQVLTGNGSIYTPQPIPPAAAVRNDVTGARAFGDTYTNSSGGVMFVTGYGNTQGNDIGSVVCIVNGDADFSITVTATIDNGACGFSFVVPNGATYEITTNTLAQGGHGVTGVGRWIETVVR